MSTLLLSHVKPGTLPRSCTVDEGDKVSGIVEVFTMNVTFTVSGGRIAPLLYVTHASVVSFCGTKDLLDVSPLPALIANL